jgi:hypothetical protein
MSSKLSCVICSPENVEQFVSNFNKSAKSLINKPNRILPRGQLFNCRRFAHQRLVNITECPFLSRLNRLDEWMACLPIMRAGVLVWRIITATNVTAGEANAQMHPRAAYSEAIFTTF